MQEPLPPVEDDRAATVGDVRSTRRWLAVTAVWAVAATALAVFALIEANKDEDNSQEQRVAGELGRVQRDLNERIDELEVRVDELPTSNDVSNLDNRLRKLEQGADQRAADAEELGGRVDELETRVDELEQSPPEGTETTP
jgi:polyhydroxyalkanoate synthesis regulator phasin